MVSLRGFVVIVALVTLAFQATDAGASCMRGKCTDAAAVDALREAIQTTCDCEGAASHKEYVKCAKRMVKAAVADGSLPSNCKKSVKKCESKSVCGIRGAVVCCRAKRSGKVTGKVVSSAAKCKKGTACARSTSVFESCGEGGTCAGPVVPFESFQEVFTGSCALPSCHSGTARQGDLALDSEEISIANLVDRPSDHPDAAASGTMRVKSGDPENSFLVQKLRGTGPGDVMPQGGEPLSERAIVLVEDWIRRGAHSTAEECPPVEESVTSPIRPLHGNDDVQTVCDDGPIDGGDFVWEPEEALPAPAPGTGIQLYAPPRPVAPGTEWETCVAYKLDWAQIAADAGYPPGELPVIKEQNYRLNKGSHHLLMYAYRGTNPDDYPEGYFPCVAGVCTGPTCPPDPGEVIVVGGRQATESPDSGVSYPPGVGLPMEEDVSVIIANIHYTNIFQPAQDIYGEAWMNFDFYAPGESKALLDGIFQIGAAFNVPPWEVQTTSYMWSPPTGVRNGTPTDAAVFQLFGHMHFRGRRFQIDYVSGGACSGSGRVCGRDDDCPGDQTCILGPDAQDITIYSTRSWDDAPVTEYPDPYILVDKEDGLRWSCTHVNGLRDEDGNEVFPPKRCHEGCNICGWRDDTRTCVRGQTYQEGEDMPLVFGLLADDDMCNMFGYFINQSDLPKLD